VQDFKKLQVWQKAHQFTLVLYRATKNFPKEEMYGLTGQIRRAAISIPANIAEGCGRSSNAELARFLHIAMGSASEVEYYLVLANDLQFLDERLCKQLEQDLLEVKRMLNSFIQKLKTSS
jgi:four helix bundle protein